MKPIEGYEQINEAGEFKPLPKGIYTLVIKEVTDFPEKSYLKIRMDIAKGEFKDYFSNIELNEFRSYKESALSFFKGFMTAVEKTNQNYKWDWNEKGLVGKFVVGVFDEEEYINNDGELKVRVALQDVRSGEAYREGRIKLPGLKKMTEEQKKQRLEDLGLNGSKVSQSGEAVGNNLPEIDDDGLPF